MRNLMIGVQQIGMAVAMLALTGTAHALSLDASGLVTDWNILPFSEPNGSTSVGNMVSVRQNNYSPINYGGSIGHRPSGGEAYDLEEMHIRRSGSLVQVLLVASSLYTDGHFYIGDLLINTDADPGFDLGLSLRNRGALSAGGLYDDITTLGLQTGSGTYRGNLGIEQQVHNALGQLAATFIAAGTLAEQGSIQTAMYNYGTIAGVKGKPTWFYEMSFHLPVTVAAFDLQVGWGCGNDVIRGSYVSTTPTDAPAMPEPATAAGAGLALLALGHAVTRKRAR